MAKIVTISREFGSGGRTIGKAVAQKLGVPYYDKALIKQVAEETGFDPAYIENAGEYAQEKSIFSYFTSFAGSTGVMGGMSASDFLWCMQRKVILDKAEEGPCVIVGRCADFILKDRTDALHVFIHADPAFRADRIVRVYGESERRPWAGERGTKWPMWQATVCSARCAVHWPLLCWALLRCGLFCAFSPRTRKFSPRARPTSASA